MKRVIYDFEVIFQCPKAVKNILHIFVVVNAKKYEN